MSPAGTWIVIFLVAGLLYVVVVAVDWWLDRRLYTRRVAGSRSRHPARVFGPDGAELPRCPDCAAHMYDPRVHARYCPGPR